MAGPVRVVLADDHPMFRFGVVAALATVPDVELVGEAAGGRELLAEVARTRPDVVLTDLAMPDMDGATATRALLDHDPGLGSSSSPCMPTTTASSGRCGRGRAATYTAA